MARREWYGAPGAVAAATAAEARRAVPAMVPALGEPAAAEPAASEPAASEQPPRAAPPAAPPAGRRFPRTRPHRPARPAPTRSPRAAGLGGRVHPGPAARDGPLGLVPQLPARVGRPWPRPSPSPTCPEYSTGSGSSSAPCRCCAQARRRPGRPPGAALAGTVVGFVVGAAAAGRDRHGAGRPVGGVPGGHPDHGVRAGDDAVPRRAGGVHRDRGGAVQPALAGGLDRGAAADRGRGDRLRGQPGGRRAVLAARVPRWWPTTSPTRSAPARRTWCRRWTGRSAS